MIPRYEMLSQNDIKTIHDASVRVLSEVGVKVYHDEALRLLADAGAEAVWEIVCSSFKISSTNWAFWVAV